MLKNIAKSIILYILKYFAKRRIKSFKGKIIAVTGSIGKTGTKDAIFSILNSQYQVRRSLSSMNSDFGLLLTVLDIPSGYSSAVKWSWLLLKGFFQSFRKDYSEILLFELGVDKKGDMDFLTSVIKPDIAIITNIAPVHMQDSQFSSLEEIYNEKKKLLFGLKEKGVAILNFDNDFLLKTVKTPLKRKIIGYGFSPESSYQITNLSYSLEGTSFTVKSGEYSYDYFTKAIGEHQGHVLLPGIICGFLLNMTPDQIKLSVERYSPPSGRMTLIAGKNSSLILDSSYNSSPEALKVALKILKTVKSTGRKIAVLGTMGELGNNSEKYHEEIGKTLPDVCDYLITVGDSAKTFAVAAESSGMNKKQIACFKTAKDAADYFENKIIEHDLILVKGSQNNIRLEKFIKQIMANPEDAKNILVRQDKEWQKRR